VPPQVAMPMFFIKTLPMMDDGDDVAMVLSPQLFNNTDVHADIFNHSNIHFWVRPGALHILGAVDLYSLCHRIYPLANAPDERAPDSASTGGAADFLTQWCFCCTGIHADRCAHCCAPMAATFFPSALHGHPIGLAAHPAKR